MTRFPTLADASHTKSGQALSRREFAQVCAAGLAAAAGARPRMSRAAAEGPFPPGRYVDVHTHVGQVGNLRPPLTAEGLLRWMDANDIAQAVVLPLISPEASSYPLTTDFVLAQTRPHQDRLIPFCSVDPRTNYRGGQQGLLDMFKRYIDAGARGCGEHKPGVRIDDPKNMAIFRACAQLKLPVLFHTDTVRNVDRPGLPGLEKVLREIPEGVFIAHAQGWWSSISGGTTQTDLGRYPKSPVAPGGAIDRLMDAYPNIYGDLSAGSGANAIRRDLEFGRRFLIRRADRLMFGTDFLSPGQDVPQLEMYGLIDLPADVQAKIFRDNARRLLGLS